VSVSPVVESHRHVAAPPQAVFERLDDQTRLAEHMEKPSLMMGGGRMTYTFDEAKGRAVGSHIRMGGKVFGIALFVDEVVTERDAPQRKVWQTVGTTRLFVIDGYKMGFALTPTDGGTDLRVWIEYTLPRGFWRWLAALPARLYARWCVGRMTADAAQYFAVAR
jgi:hypothetical protein